MRCFLEGLHSKQHSLHEAVQRKVVTNVSVDGVLVSILLLLFKW
mgnify:CR=1 FL=1